jgi:exosortase
VNNPKSSEHWDFMEWCRGNPVAVALLATIAGTLVYFFGAVHLFVNGSETAADWARKAWTPEQDQEHSWIVPFVFLWLVWYHWAELVKAPKRGSNLGLVFAGAGILFYVLSTRCLEPRMALISIPFLLYGSILFIWGKNVARIMMFPCAFLIFLIPFGVIQQATFRLQFIITGTVSVLANLVGIHNTASGTTLSGQNGSFHFDVAEGCSGIHSIIAITMITSIYMHIAESQLWKKAVVLFCSVLFAIIGNIGRIFTILLVAKLFGMNLATNYHTISGYLIYPFAILAMIGLSSLLNIDKGHHPETGQSPPPTTPPEGSGPQKPGHGDPTYDYDY